MRQKNDKAYIPNVLNFKQLKRFCLFLLIPSILYVDIVS